MSFFIYRTENFATIQIFVDGLGKYVKRKETLVGSKHYYSYKSTMLENDIKYRMGVELRKH